MHTLNSKSRFLRPLLAAVGATALLGVAPAFAADVISEEPPAPAPVEVAPPPAGWAGPYAGGQVGYGFSGRVRAPGNSVDTKGFSGRGFGGFNAQNGQFVYGFEGDIGYDGTHGSNATTSARSNLNGSARVRAGVAATDRVLLYATGGGAAERLRVSDAAGRDSNTMFGWTAGAGVDAKITDKVFGRVEYRYTDYGSKVFDTGSGPQRFSDRKNTVEVGLGIQF